MVFFMPFVPLLAALVLIAVNRWTDHRIGYFVLPIPAAVFLLYLTQLPNTISGGSLQTSIPWVPSLGLSLSFQINGLSMLFALLISFVGSIVVLYSIFYLSQKERLKNFYVFLLLFMGAMLGVVTADNLILLYFFWELTSISSFLLIGFWYEKERSRYGAQKAMLLTVAGGICMLIAFILLGRLTGTYEISELLLLSEAVKGSGLYPAIAVLIMLGAFTKSAQVPFHIWLPSAMEAPTPISCYLHSATMVKAGIYLIARFSPLLGETLLWNGTVTVVGLISLLFGSFMALRQKDMKALLAYSTISQLGLIVCLFGIGTQTAILAALLHLLNHSAFKGSLFLMTGIVDHETGTRDLTLLRGLGKVMPYTGAVAFIGACAMAGLPPFAGFLSKELFFEAAYESSSGILSALGGWNPVIAFVAVLASLFTFVYSLSIFGRVFLGGEITDKTPKHPHEAPFGMLLPAMTLVSLNIIIALVPNLFAKALVLPAVKTVSGVLPKAHLSFWHGITPPLLMTLCVVVLGAVLYSRLDSFQNLIGRFSSPVGANKCYDRSIPAFTSGSYALTESYMTGSLTTYLIYIIIATVFFTALPVADNGFLFAMSLNNLANVEWLEVVMVIVTAIPAVSLCFIRKRVHAVLALGAVGFIMSLFFIILSAPDLALTQLLVESVTLILYILVLRELPVGMHPEKPSSRKRISLRVFISVTFGAFIAFLSFFSHSNRLYTPISWFYTQNSKTLGGGNNVVNVTLVDFRGLDTMGEITVLCLAAFGVYVLIHLFKDKDGKTKSIADTYSLENNYSYNESENNIILLFLAQPIALVILFVSVYLYQAGHNAPGGGFIGGLMASCALLLMYVTLGKSYMTQIPIRLSYFLPIGLCFAVGTGLAGLFIGDAFLWHTFGHVTLPVLGSIELTTASIFDLGVYLVVIGTVMSIIFNISKQQN